MWLKKMKHKKLQLLLIGLVLLTTAGLFNMCLCFTSELTSFSKSAINKGNCPDAYILTIGTKNFEDHFTDETYKNEVESVSAMTGKAITVPIKHNANDITMYYDMMLSVENYKDWGYLELSAGDNNKTSPGKGEVWVSETLAVPNDIKLGDIITLEYDQPLELKVTAFYRTTCFPKAVGYSPMIVSKEELSKAQGAEDAALFAVNVKNYSDYNVKELFKNSKYCVVDRTRDDAQANLIEYSNTFGLIGAMAAAIVFLVTLIILRFIIKTNLLKEFRTIGIYKSLGYTSKKIIGFYMKGYLLVGIVSITIGAFTSLSIVQKIGIMCTEYVDGFSLSKTSLNVSAITIVVLMILLFVNLKIALGKVKKITPVEAIAVGLTSTEKKLPQSVIKNAKTPKEMAINEMLKYRKSTVMMMLVLTVSMYLSMLFVMIWYSSDKMLDNSNLWFCLPQRDTYVAGNISDDLIEYLDDCQYVKSAVYGDFSYNEELKLDDYINVVSGIRFDIYSNFSENITGVHILKGEPPKSKDEILVGTGLLKAINLQVGDYIKLTLKDVTKEYRISGSYSTVADSGKKIMLTTGAAKECIEGYTSSRAYVKLKNINDYEKFKKEIEDKFSGIAVDKKWIAMENSVESIRGMLESVSGVLVAVFILFSMLNFVIVVLMDNKNFRRKFGIMKSLGFTTDYIIRQNLSKYLIMSVFSSVISLCLHLLISKKLMAVLLIDAFVNSNILLGVLSIGFVGLILLATLLISLPIRKISPVELMEE